MTDQTLAPGLEEIRSEFAELAGVLKFVPFQPRIFYNTFPKSGTHLANLLCAHLAHRQTPKHWLGTFRGHSWTSQWMPDEYLLPVIHGQPAGTWYQGHMGYKEKYAQAFDEVGVSMLFVYRDLRDVAVSQTYHIELADGENRHHPGQDDFMALPTHADRLTAVLTGLGVWTGLLARWELYAGWLDVPWVLPIRYEDMRDKPREVATQVVEYVIERTTAGQYYLLFDDTLQRTIDKATELLSTTKYSSSYRKGVSGEWKREFSDYHKKLFKQLDVNNWIVRLGYEENADW